MAAFSSVSLRFAAVRLDASRPLRRSARWSLAVGHLTTSNFNVECPIKLGRCLTSIRTSDESAALHNHPD